jgi:hypothetical protein
MRRKRRPGSKIGNKKSHKHKAFIKKFDRRESGIRLMYQKGNSIAVDLGGSENLSTLQLDAIQDYIKADYRETQLALATEENRKAGIEVPEWWDKYRLHWLRLKVQIRNQIPDPILQRKAKDAGDLQSYLASKSQQNNGEEKQQ